MKGKNSDGDDLLVATSLGITFELVGENLPKSTGDDSPNSTGEAFQTALGKISNSTRDMLYFAGEYSYTPLGNIKTVGDIKPFRC